MPLEITAAEAVFERISKNKNRSYPSENRGRERLFPFAQPVTQAGFRFDETAKIFATGSCFARNIEKSLHYINANVISSPLDIDSPAGAKQVFQLYNKYTIHSILNEFRWAIGCVDFDHQKLLIKRPDGRYQDLQVSAADAISGTLEEMTAFRKSFNASFARARDADVVIITLGLVECWYDRELEVYMNVAPTRSLTKTYPGRFDFRLLDYNDIYDALCEIHGLLTSGERPVPKILLTVSPVPLASTFRSEDVLVANCYSKSVQRAAVEAFVSNHNAFYFPSYEYVTLTDRKFAWLNTDFRHVRAETVDRIMADVLLTYVGPSAAQRQLETRGHATALFENGDFDAVVEMIEIYISEGDDDADLLWIYARSLRKLQRNEECVVVCRRIVGIDGRMKKSAARTALFTLQQLGKPEEGAELLDWYQKNYPEEIEFLARFV